MLDWTHIIRLRQEVGEDSFAEIVDLFFAEVNEVFERIRNNGAKHTDMHFLKGSAANLGFAEFSKACQIAEHALLTEDGEADIQSVFSSFEASCESFSEGLAKRRA